MTYNKVLICHYLKNASKDGLDLIMVTEPMKPSKSENKWKQKVYEWLAEEGMFRKEVDNTQASFHFGINYPVGSPYHIEVLKPRDMKDGILIVAVLRVAPSHKTALAKLSAEQRKPIIHDLKIRLLHRRPGFSVKEDDGVWDAVQFQIRLFYDNLSKTLLHEAIDDIFRSMITVVWTFGHHFGIPSGQKEEPGFYA